VARSIPARARTADRRAARDVAGAIDAADTTEIKVIGLRRLIAERMSEAKRTIPHFAYVEEVDVTELESLREHLNHARPKTQGSLSYLPLVVMALTRVLESFPQCKRFIRCRARRVGKAPRHACGIATADVGWPEGSCRAQRAVAYPMEMAAEIRRLARARAQQQDHARGVGRIHDYGHEPGQTRRHRIHAHHQRAEVAIIRTHKAVSGGGAQGAVVVRRIMNLSSFCSIIASWTL